MRVVDQLQSVSMRFYSKSKGGEILNSVLNEIERTKSALGVTLILMTQGMMLLTYLGLMFWISWELSLIALVLFSVLTAGLSNIVSRVKQQGEKITETSGTFTSAIAELIEGIRTITVHNKQNFERQRIESATSNYADAVVKTARFHSMIRPLSRAVVGTILLGLILFAVQYFVLTGTLDMAYLLTFLFAMFRMMPIVNHLNILRGDWAQNRAGITNVAALLREDDKPYLPDGSRTASSLQTAIEFENVTFGYEPDQPVLKNIDLTIKRGCSTALVGGSGAGKTTLADLIPRLYDPDEGSIRFDGVDIREFTKHSLRSQIGIVSQHTHIFNDTVANNISYGNPSASFEEIVEVARQANALDFIEDMEQGFETSLGDRGVRLSGGQRQRIAIARALLLNPEILIMDEATSALDSVSEQLVQRSLERLMEGRTVLAIAHRLSTIENADWVVVLEEGRIVEQGPYAELLERRGQLWKYHSLQFSQQSAPDQASPNTENDDSREPLSTN
jgi:subfamily B ATP-binding cassette protein MsbA